MAQGFKSGLSCAEDIETGTGAPQILYCRCYVNEFFFSIKTFFDTFNILLRFCLL